MVIAGKRFEVLIHKMHRATVRQRKSIHDAHACICARLHGSYGLHHSLLRQYCTLGGRLRVQTILNKRMHPLLAASSGCTKAIDITVRGRTASETFWLLLMHQMSEVCAPRYLAGLVSTTRSRHLCQKPLKGVRLTPCVPGCQAGIALYIHTYILMQL